MFGLDDIQKLWQAGLLTLIYIRKKWPHHSLPNIFTTVFRCEQENHQRIVNVVIMWDAKCNCRFSLLLFTCQKCLAYIRHGNCVRMSENCAWLWKTVYCKFLSINLPGIYGFNGHTVFSYTSRTIQQSHINNRDSWQRRHMRDTLHQSGKFNFWLSPLTYFGSLI